MENFRGNKKGNKNLKKLVSFTTIATLVFMGSAFAFDNYNAKYLNTPEAKKEALARVCSAQDNNSFYICERWRKNGVPNSDIRLGIAAVATVVGAGVGGAVVANPSLVGVSGALKIGGWTPSFVQGAVAAGALAGTVTYGVTNLIK